MFGIREIELVLENVEVIRIDGKYIGLFVLDDIRKTARNIGSSAFGFVETAGFMALELHRDANENRTDKGDLLFDRLLRYNDIAFVEILGSNGEYYRFSLDWDESNADVNKFQTSAIGFNKNLYIVVSKDQTVRKFFWESGRPDRKSWVWTRTGWGNR